jgi:hypothetical protein
VHDQSFDDERGGGVFTNFRPCQVHFRAPAHGQAPLK